MQKIIVKNTAKEIRLENMMGTEIVAYHSLNSDAYCVLTKLTSKNLFERATEVRNRTFNTTMYGFVPLNSSTSEPRFVATTWQDAIKLASEKRDVMTFKTMQEMLTAMVNKAF